MVPPLPASGHVRTGAQAGARPQQRIHANRTVAVARRARHRSRLFLGLSCTVALLAWHAAAVGARAHTQWQTVTVRAGDSLWGLSSRYAPAGEDPRRWIYDVERVNGLASGGLFVGQTLRLPALR